MNKTAVVDLLTQVGRVRQAFDSARIEHNAEVSLVMRRLVMEGAVNYMSAEEMAEASGYTPKAIRTMLRNEGLDPRMKKPMLSKHSARVLADNAALLGVDESALLLSPLAYLPAGSLLRKADEAALSKVTEVDDDVDYETLGRMLVRVMNDPDEMYVMFDGSDLCLDGWALSLSDAEVAAVKSVMVP